MTDTMAYVERRMAREEARRKRRMAEEARRRDQMELMAVLIAGGAATIAVLRLAAWVYITIAAG